jgi:hypothetical protein
MASQERVRRLADRRLSIRLWAEGVTPFGMVSQGCMRLSIRLWTEGVAPFAIFLFALTAASLNLGEQMAKFPLLGEAGYPDSYILYDIQHFQQTGVIYRDLSQPPSQPSQYSPMLYVLLALPGSLLPIENPFVGPRVIVFAAYLLCVVVTASIAHAIIPLRITWLWGILLGSSITCMTVWILQLRGDFLGILFELLAIRLLLRPSPWATLIAGTCAGLALQFKITMIAAPAAGILWLFLNRNWRLLLLFVLAGLATSGGLYFFFSFREPRMIAQMTALTTIIPDYRGLIYHIARVLGEPVSLLAVAALIGQYPLRPWRPWKLLLLFSAISFCIAALTDVQAGGNLNYFYEFLFSATPLAVLSVFYLKADPRKWKAGSVCLAGLIGFYIMLLIVRDFQSLRERLSLTYIRTANQQASLIREAFQGRHIFTTVPYVALFDPQPAMIEPFLFSYLQRVGKLDPTPVMNSLAREEFEAVVTQRQAPSYRGIDHISPGLRQAIITAYTPHCELYGLLVHLPRDTAHSGGLRTKLQEIGCQPVLCDNGGSCPPWSHSRRWSDGVLQRGVDYIDRLFHIVRAYVCAPARE